MAADDRLTGELAAIKNGIEAGLDPRQSANINLAPRVAADAARLVKALEAVLKLAADWEATAAELDRDAIRGRKSNYTSDHQQSDTDQEIAKEYREHAGELRDAIARELTGTETT